DAVRWVRTWSDEQTGTFRVGRLDAEPVAEWVGTARLWAGRRGSPPRLEVAEGVDPAWVDKLRNGPVAALLGHLEGRLSFHASAVVLDEGGSLFVGDSGAGKSTLAADLCAHGGAAFLGDDTVALAMGSSDVDVCPTERIGWLTPQSGERYGVPRHPTEK